MTILDLNRLNGLAEKGFAGQYQQSPAPLGGGLVKAEWFKRYRENESPERFDRNGSAAQRSTAVLFAGTTVFSTQLR